MVTKNSWQVKDQVSPIQGIPLLPYSGNKMHRMPSRAELLKIKIAYI